MGQELFAVVIVTWNAERFIRPCLEALAGQTVQDFCLILVDNGSTDATVALARDVFDFADDGRFRLIRNSGNTGFCRANNQALGLCRAPYALILNSDVVLERDFLGRALAAIDAAGPEYGLFNPTVLRPDGKTIDTLGLLLSGNRRFFNIDEGRAFDREMAVRRDIFGPCGAAAIVRREVLEDMKEGADGYFDPRFFFLAEDFDMAWKAREKGWKALYIPEPLCRHYGQSARFRNRFRQYLSFRNRYFLIIKHEGPGVFFKHLFRPYDIARAIYMLAVCPRLTIKAFKEVRAFLAEERHRRA